MHGIKATGRCKIDLAHSVIPSPPHSPFRSSFPFCHCEVRFRPCDDRITPKWDCRSQEKADDTTFSPVWNAMACLQELRIAFIIHWRGEILYSLLFKFQNFLQYKKNWMIILVVRQQYFLALSAKQSEAPQTIFPSSVPSLPLSPHQCCWEKSWMLDGLLCESEEISLILVPPTTDRKLKVALLHCRS